ncbi:MAG: hypothetical protein HQ546_11925 [Planctomycetes bacterium]|nr:hypothetical protein [Planctomycetota bacterium]
MRSLGTTFFGNKTRAGAWGQMVGIVVNGTDSDRLAEVEYTASDPKWGRVLFRRQVWMPSRSQGDVWFAARIGELSTGQQQQSPQSRFSFSLQSGSLLDAATEQVLDRTSEIQMVPMARLDKLTCFIDDSGEPTEYSYLAREEEGRRYISKLELTTLTYMPDRWYGYSAVDLLLVGWLDPDRRRASQFQAIMDWVRQGGVLVLFTTERSDELLATDFGAAAGVTASGVGQIKRLSVTSADGKADFTVELPKAVPYLEMSCDRAEVLYSANGLPMLTRTRYGLGFVFVLAVPTGALAQTEPQGLMEIWQEVYYALNSTAAIRTELFAGGDGDTTTRQSSTTQSKRTTRPSAGENAVAKGDNGVSYDILQDISGRRGLGRMAVLAWLGAFMLMTVGVGCVMSLRRYGERTWIVMLPIAMVLAGGIYLYSESRADAPAVSYVGMAISDSSGRAMVQEALGYYSPVEVTGLEVLPGSALGYLFPMGQRDGKSLTQTRIYTVGGAMMPAVRVGKNSASAFLATAMVDFAGFATDLRFGPDGLEGTITNRTGSDVADAVLYIRRRAYRVGDLPAGESVHVTTGSDDRLGPEEFIPKAIKSREDLMHEKLLQRLTTQSHVRLPDERLYLLGWSADRLLDPGEGLAGVPAVGMTLLAEPITVRSTLAGQRVFIPQEMVHQRFENFGIVWSPKAGFAKTLWREDKIEVLVSPPAEVGRLAQTEAILYVTIRANSYRMTVEGLSQDGSAVALETYDHPEGLKIIRVLDADRFVTADGTVRLRLRVESIGAISKNIVERPKWQFEDIVATLRGTVQ